MKKAVILFSGGLDSTTLLKYAQNLGYDCHPISFNYNQRHSAELEAAKRIATKYKVSAHKIINIPTDMFGSSALTDSSIEIPEFKGEHNDIPVTYVPARNTIFLALALGYAETIKAYDIFIGVSSVDYSNYPDCRPEFIEAFEKLANLATKEAVEGHKLTLHTPLLHLSKAQTIKLGLDNNVDYALTVSCYSATREGKACGTCHSCGLRKKGFLELNVADPTQYI
ncbi:MAG: 7-cyano-7-deazaguanine synthase QueC [Proteobacteria bacterium]|nr:7-cyano-7-deazaguanine synthase QueC [Pseudomonadota bacterium]